MKLIIIGWFFLSLLGVFANHARSKALEERMKELEGVLNPLPKEAECIPVAERIVSDPSLSGTTLHDCAAQFLAEVARPEAEKHAPRNLQLRAALLMAIAHRRQLSTPLDRPLGIIDGKPVDHELC